MPSLDDGDAMPSQKYRDYSNVPDSTKRGIYYLLLIHDHGVSIQATFARYSFSTKEHLTA
jgi:hypothetical protein